MRAIHFLTLEQQLILLRELLETFDHADSLVAALRGRGFYTFFPFFELVEQSGASPEEIERSHLVRKEKAKEQFAWPTESWHRPWYPELFARMGYRSPLLQRLEDERWVQLKQEKPNIPYETLPLWEREIDPILRRHYQNNQEDPVGERHRMEQRRDCLRTSLISETEQLATILSDSFQWSEQGCWEFYTDVMARETESLAFLYDAKRSTKTNIVFSKNLNTNWDLCFFGSKFLWTPENACFDIKLAVAPSLAIKRPAVHDRGDFMFLSYELVVPFFKAAYWHFESLREFEVVLKARGFLYERMHSVVEEHLIRLLPNHNEK